MPFASKNKNNEPAKDSVQYRHEALLDKYLRNCIVWDLIFMKKMVHKVVGDFSEHARTVRKIGSRTSLALMAHELLKKQARVKRTKEILNIVQLEHDNTFLQSSYMDAPRSSKQSILYQLPMQFWAKPKILQCCMNCQAVAHREVFYMPLCSGCERIRCCSQKCLKQVWCESGHKHRCEGGNMFKHEMTLVYAIIPSLMQDFMYLSECRAPTPFWELSFADVYGERLQLRPLKLTKQIKDIFATRMDDKVFRSMLKPPYQSFGIILWSHNGDDRYICTPMIVRGDIRSLYVAEARTKWQFKQHQRDLANYKDFMNTH